VTPRGTPGPAVPADLRLDEQAALRRVATAVARQRTPDEIFGVVTEEVGGLFGATASTLFRFEGTEGVGVSDWHTDDAEGVPPGMRIDLERESATGRVYQTAAPTRLAYDEVAHGDIDARLRALGIRYAIAAPIVVDDALWGSISLSTIDEDPFPPGAELRLAAFAELVAQAVGNAEARSQLTASRVRIVAAADEARRRLERDLHDGVQQRLVALALQLRMAQRTAGDAAATKAALEACSEELAAALEELRELARGIHPAVLTERGLPAALQSIVDRAPVPVELDVRLEERLAPAQEAALYFTASEALANVAKYAEARSAVVRAWRDGRIVVIEIADDGVGGADTGRGSGLRGLCDRVEAVGGRLEISSPPGAGTRIVARLPC
jgi:signal transduction histidine kinase